MDKTRGQSLGRWVATAHPHVGEGTVIYRPVANFEGRSCSSRSLQPAELLPQRNRTPQSRSTLRRFLAEYHVTDMYTLTYRHPTYDNAAVREDMRAVVRQHRRMTAGRPWAWVAEDHSNGGGKHVHLAVTEDAPHPLALWPHGYIKSPVWEDIEASTPYAQKALVLARYMTKQPTPAGMHRYHRSRGPVTRVMGRYDTQEEARHALSVLFGGPPHWDKVVRPEGTVPVWTGRYTPTTTAAATLAPISFDSLTGELR